MNHVTLIGRLTKDPDVRYSQGQDPTCVARYTLAVDRRAKSKNGEQNADFISCVAFGKAGEFAEKYLHKGTKIAVNGRIRTGSYTNREGMKIYTTDVVINDHEFCDSRQDGETNGGGHHNTREPDGPDGFMKIPDGIDEELPFK